MWNIKKIWWLLSCKKNSCCLCKYEKIWRGTWYSETFAEYFKPDIIPNSREEFNLIAKEEKMNTITEYTELICDIYAVKKFIGKNAEYERQIMEKIENMSAFGVCAKFKIDSWYPPLIS